MSQLAKVSHYSEQMVKADTAGVTLGVTHFWHPIISGLEHQERGVNVMQPLASYPCMSVFRQIDDALLFLIFPNFRRIISMASRAATI